MLLKALRGLADSDRYLFTLADLAGLLPDMSPAIFKTLMSRLVTREDLVRVCRGIYLTPWVKLPHGRILYHAAARLRADCFCYLSLESVLSEAGLISQIPLQRITLMTSGRSNTISCGRFGIIEFTHTRQRPEEVRSHLRYDPDIRLWRAEVPQALRDLRRTGRNTDLIQGGEDESV